MQPYAVHRKALDSYVKSRLSLPYLCVTLSFPSHFSHISPSTYPSIPTGLQGKALTKRTSHLPLAVLTGSVSGGPLGHATFCWCPQRAVSLASRSNLKGLRWPQGMMGTSPQTTHQIQSAAIHSHHSNGFDVHALELSLKPFLFSLLINKGILSALEAISVVLCQRCGPDGDWQ